MKRLSAQRVRICDLMMGKYFPGNKEEFKPAFVVTPWGQRISRVNLIATVIDKFVSEDGNYGTLVIDDGSDAIRVKVFRDAVKLVTNVEKGDRVLVIGKVREYGGEIYGMLK
jgi:RPA family protein